MTGFRRNLVLVAVLTFAFSAQGFDGKSAARSPGLSYRLYQWANQSARLFAQTPTPSAPTAVDSAIAYGKGALPAPQIWDSETSMLERFKEMRNLRFMPSPNNPDFQRRISWLFPDDGCFARAALAIKNLTQRWSAPAPSKVFVFGDLDVHTVNAPGGEVTWWYHVAPIVQVNGVNYVLDPALQPDSPLALETWLAKMSPDIKSLQVAICKSGTYTPYDDCSIESDGVEAQADQDQPGYLTNEWDRLVELKRIPEDELGEKPPWTL